MATSATNWKGVSRRVTPLAGGFVLKRVQTGPYEHIYAAFDPNRRKADKRRVFIGVTGYKNNQRTNYPYETKPTHADTLDLEVGKRLRRKMVMLGSLAVPSKDTRQRFRISDYRHSAPHQVGMDVTMSAVRALKKLYPKARSMGGHMIKHGREVYLKT